MDTTVYHSSMSMENEYPKLKSPGFIGKKLLPPLLAPRHKCYISGTKRNKMLIFSVNNNDGARSITLKNYDDHLICMGGVRGQIPPTRKS